MRLAIVVPSLETFGGSERVVLKIAQHFNAKIYVIRYNANTTYPEFKNLDIEVVGSAFGKIPFLKRLTSAIEAGKVFYDLKLSDYDLINAHQSPSEFARNYNAPMLWFNYTPNREAFDLYEWRMKRRGIVQKVLCWAAIKAFRHLEFKIVPKIEYIFTISKNSQARIKKYLYRDSEVLYPGIDAKEFYCKDYEKFFFYPSRIVPEKEIEYAIDAFKIFSAKNKNWKLVIAGSVSESPTHKTYFEKIKSMADERINIIPNVSDEKLKELYARCYAVLYTPINEDLGLVPLEAMAAKKPCIARNEGGPKETITTGEDGFLVNTPEEMAQKMLLLAKRPELAEEMGKQGCRKITKKFTWKRFLKRFEEKANELSSCAYCNE